MAAAKHRVSIVRISRRPVHQISPDGNHDEPDKTKSKYDHSHLDKTLPAERVRQKNLFCFKENLF
jgi:hypothetical protein